MNKTTMAMARTDFRVWAFRLGVQNPHLKRGSDFLMVGMEFRGLRRVPQR
jgi:hypothetical protein